MVVKYDLGLSRANITSITELLAAPPSLVGNLVWKDSTKVREKSKYTTYLLFTAICPFFYYSSG